MIGSVVRRAAGWSRGVVLILGVIATGWPAASFVRADAPGNSAGYEVQPLRLPADVLPSCMTVRADGTLVIGSMDGDILLVVDGDGDGLPETYQRWAGTLPHWPLGLLAEGDDLLLAARSGLLRLSDRDHDGWAETWTTVSDAWDVSRDHHDWTTGVVRWPQGGWVVCTATDDVRARDVKGRHYLRGKALRVEPDGSTTVLAEGLRYPTGWAADGLGRVFFTDNQGQQKTTCEINRLIPQTWYGYPSQADPPHGPPGLKQYQPVVRIPYPWARSVNGLAFARTGGKFGPLEGQLVLCEYNNRFILRASLEEVDGTMQGACYPFLERLLGPLCLAFAPDGSLYVGSLREPAWGGEPEQGAIYRVRYSGRPSFGLQELKAEPDGFTLVFFTPPPDREAARDASRYKIRRYHHVFQGSYHSPPVDEEHLTVDRAELASDGRQVRLKLREPMRADRIYEVRLDLEGASPSVGHYTMNRVPR